MVPLMTWYRLRHGIAYDKVLRMTDLTRQRERRKGQQQDPPETQSIDCKDDELAEAKAEARGVAGLLNVLGGLHQLLLIQPADLDLQ